MIKNILLPLCIMLLVSCGNDKGTGNDNNNVPATDAGKVYTPVQLNEKIMAIEASLQEPMLKAEAEIKVRGGNGNIAGVAQSAKAMEDTIQLRLNEVKALSPVGVGGEDYKLVATRYFEHLKSIYTLYKEIAEAKEENIKIDKANQMQTVISAQPAILTNLQLAQQKYAADNGFVY